MRYRKHNSQSFLPEEDFAEFAAECAKPVCILSFVAHQRFCASGRKRLGTYLSTVIPDEAPLPKMANPHRVDSPKALFRLGAISRARIDIDPITTYPGRAAGFAVTVFCCAVTEILRGRKTFNPNCLPVQPSAALLVNQMISLDCAEFPHTVAREFSRVIGVITTNYFRLLTFIVFDVLNNRSASFINCQRKPSAKRHRRTAQPSSKLAARLARLS